MTGDIVVPPTGRVVITVEGVTAYIDGPGLTPIVLAPGDTYTLPRWEAAAIHVRSEAAVYAETDARRTIDRIRALHRPSRSVAADEAPYCVECSRGWHVTWPCDTARATGAGS